MSKMLKVSAIRSCCTLRSRRVLLLKSTLSLDLPRGLVSIEENGDNDIQDLIVFALNLIQVGQGGHTSADDSGELLYTRS